MIRVKWTSTMDFVPLREDLYRYTVRDGILIVTGRLSNESFSFGPSEWETLS